MKPHLWALPILLYIVYSLFPSPTFAGASLETATDASFSNITENFSPGQSIFVRVSANNNGETSRKLNLLDNQYNQLESFTLNKLSDNQFSLNFNAPQNEGYYSLEARIESSGSISTSVKTIKIGNPNNASVKVNIQNKVQGQSVTVQNNTTNQEASRVLPSPTPASPTPSPQPEFFDNPDFTFEDEAPRQSNFLLNLEQFFKKLWANFWPFRN